MLRLSFKHLFVGIAVLSGCVGAQQGPTVQGWSASDLETWYSKPQGSRLLPMAWFKALEQPSNEKLFSEPDYLASFRFIQPRPGTNQQLPIGFAADLQSDDHFKSGHTHLRWYAGQGPTEPWVGLTCAACHTGQLAYQGTVLRIEGGSSMIDFQSFIEALNAAMARTLSDPAKADRFASRVLNPSAGGAGAADTPPNRKMLHDELAAAANFQAEQLRINAIPLRYGFGRLDAFGHIFNRVTLDASVIPPAPQPSDAPVRYPYLWNIHQLPSVQYNGFAPNTPVTFPNGSTFDLMALARNAAEVSGVFADVVIVPQPDLLDGYSSSVLSENLIAINQKLTHLRPPEWPAALFGSPTPESVTAGGKLFEKHCVACHVELKDMSTMVPERISYFNEASAKQANDNKPPGTDIWMACNAYAAMSSTGMLGGVPKGFLSTDPPLGQTALNRDMLKTMVVGELVNQRYTIAADLLKTMFGGDIPFTAPAARSFRAQSRSLLSARDQLRQRCLTTVDPLLGYKSRPLVGIWAAPPYLHNGSVPSLYQLLLPAERRVSSFLTGTTEFDPHEVGYVRGAAPGNTFRFNTRDTGGNIIPGNDNGGHDYRNADLSDEQRFEIVDYLKTLVIPARAGE